MCGARWRCCAAVKKTYGTFLCSACLTGIFRAGFQAVQVVIDAPPDESVRVWRQEK